VSVKIELNAVVGDDQVGPAVVVEIAGADRKVLAARLINLRRLRHVGERAVAVIVIERGGRTGINRRWATGRNAGADQTRAPALLPQKHKNADVKIQPAVPVINKKTRAAIEPRARKPRAE